MRFAACIPVLTVLLASVACGSTPAPQAKAPVDEPTGATAGQASDGKANRPLTHEECEQLGQSITDTCHSNNTRIATIEGWCSDVIAGVSSGTWVSDCEKHIKYVDAVCFSSTDNVRAMKDCDSAVSR
ncbi:MAG TPA: hypothetical protein VGL81_37145 [Polyangiaceae bacterium]|jgi:hypothetical protein